MMATEFRALVRRRFPFRLRLIALGVVVGELIGLAKLATGHSVDTATAAGIAGVVGVTVGIWIGAALALTVLKFNQSRISIAKEAISQALEIQTPGLPESIPNDRSPISSQGRPTGSLGWCLIGLPTWLLIVAPVPILFTILDMGHSLFEPAFWRPFALWVGNAAIVGLAIQQLVIQAMLKTTMRMLQTARASSQREPAQGQATNSMSRYETQVQQRIQDCQKASGMAPGWIERITGISASWASSDGYSGSPA